MMPDLGTYGVWVLSAYGAALGLLGGLVAVSAWRGARVKRQLAEAEREARNG